MGSTSSASSGNAVYDSIFRKLPDSGGGSAQSVGASSGASPSGGSVFRQVPNGGQGGVQGGASTPAGSSQAIADQLSFRNVTSENDFSPAHGIECSRGGGQDQFAIRCHATLFDSERSAQLASLDFLIYDSPPSFSAEDSKLASGVHGAGGRWKVDETRGVTIRGPNGVMNLQASCHQTLDTARNGPGVCMVPADPRVLVVANVAPETATSQSVTADSPDTGRAALGAEGEREI